MKFSEIRDPGVKFLYLRSWLLYLRPYPFISWPIPFIFQLIPFYIFHHDLLNFFFFSILFLQATRSRSQSLIKHFFKFFTLKSSYQPMIWVHCSSLSFINAKGHSLSRSVERWHFGRNSCLSGSYNGCFSWFWRNSLKSESGVVRCSKV